IAFAASDDKLRTLNVSTKQTAILDSSRYGGISGVVWSPDSKWIAYTKSDVTRSTDIYVTAASGEEKEPHKLTFDSYSDTNAMFSPDGRKLFFQRVEPGSGNAPNSSQIYSVGLEHLDRDPDVPEEREAEPNQAQPQPEGAEGG